MTDWTDDPVARVLLDDIVAAPGDDTPRLILADRLEDLGLEPRANVIRQMIAHPKKFAGDTADLSLIRAYEWLSLHADAEVGWLYGLPSEPNPGGYVWCRRHVGLVGTLTWVRGFVGAVELPWYRFCRGATRLFRTFPLQRVTLSDCLPEALERPGGSDLVYCWNRTADPSESNWPDADESSCLSPELFDLLPLSSPGDADEELYRSRGLVVYESQSAARDALADAALALGRKWRDDKQREGDL